MDLLSRLIAGSGASPTKQKANTPAERLAACKRACNALQHIWRNANSISEDEGVKLQITGYLKRLNSVLHDESRRTAPHSCLQYACSTQIFIIVTKLAISAEDEAVTATSVSLFHILINGETENLLDSKIFARSLIDLVRKSRGVGEQGEADLVDLLFEICAKIRVDPDILPAWFYPERRQSPSTERTTEDFRPPKRSASLARQDQFPLFYVLVDFVHHDGSSGDFARTGLLYLIETTSRSQSLEKWMIESDLAPQMASGLGALYSRLNRSPATLPQVDIFSPGPLAAPSVKRPPNKHRVPGEFEASESDEVHEEELSEASQSVNAFLSYLAFWQDTLNHCSSPEVADTLLDHFQVLFVQQLLYPSLLESSDMDGGSTAAVIVHLYRILDALQQRKLLQRILDYVLSSQQRKQFPSNGKRRPRMSVSRRKSIDKLAAMIQSNEDPSPDLFNLLDLISLSLKSSRPQTSTAALKLISVMLRKHHDLVFTTLFQMSPCETLSQSRDGFEKELILLFRAAMGIMDTPTIDQSYQALLGDVQGMLNEHCCDLSHDEEGLQLTAATLPRFEVREGCRLMKTLRDLFHSFFANDIMVNIALTETIICLACCKFVSLHGWLIHTHEKTSRAQEPSIVDILQEQVTQIQRWRGQILQWDALYSMQQARLLGAPASITMPKSPQTSSFDRPLSPVGLHISNASPKANISSHLSGASRDQSGDDSTTVNDMKTLLQMHVELPKAEEPQSVPPVLPSLAERLSLESCNVLSSTPSEGMSSGSATPSFLESSTRSSVTLDHILTSAIILQEFLLEIAAVVQVRASLFAEVETLTKE